MSTLANRPNTALLVVDLQNAVVAGAHQRDEVLAQVIAHTNLYWTRQSAPGRTADTVTTKDAHFTKTA